MTNTTNKTHLDLYTVGEIQEVLRKELQSIVIELETKLHDAKKTEWWSEASKLQQSIYEVSTAKHKVLMTLHAMWAEAAEVAFPHSAIKVEKVETLTSPAEVELPEIPAKKRTLAVVPTPER